MKRNMNSKKLTTVKKHEKIYKDVESLLAAQKVSTVWAACILVGKRNRMTAPSVSVVYYNARKRIRLETSKDKSHELQ